MSDTIWTLGFSGPISTPILYSVSGAAPTLYGKFMYGFGGVVPPQIWTEGNPH